MNISTLESNQIISLSNFVEQISHLNDEKYEYCYRGHDDKSYKLNPTIYRNNNFIENEDKIIREAIMRNPEEFLNLKTNFEILAKMQHYEFPTRLLNLTENPLVALFFAVSSKDKKDGSVIVFKIAKDIIKYYDSDTVSILSAIAKTEHSKFKLFNEELKQQILSNEDASLKEIRSRLNKNTEQNSITTVFNYISSKNSKKNIKEKLRDIFNSTKLVNYITQEIRTEKSHFTGSIEISDFYNHIVYVKSKYDTKRISSQQGSFLLYGIKDADKTKQAEFGKKQIDTTEYIIPYDKKKQILKELLKCGISQERLFPEIVNSAKVIKNKFGL